MEEIVLQKLNLKIENFDYSSDLERIEKSLKSMAGVHTLGREEKKLSITYHPDIISAYSVREAIKELGYSIERKSRTKNPFKRFVKWLADSNEKDFGNESLDCCTINRRHTSK